MLEHFAKKSGHSPRNPIEAGAQPPREGSHIHSPKKSAYYGTMILTQSRESVANHAQFTNIRVCKAWRGRDGWDLRGYLSPDEFMILGNFETREQATDELNELFHAIAQGKSSYVVRMGTSQKINEASD